MPTRRRGRAAARVDGAGPRGARARGRRCRSRTEPSGPARRSTAGATIEEIYRAAVAETKRHLRAGEASTLSQRDERATTAASTHRSRGAASPTEEELRARIEEQMRKVRVQDVLLAERGQHDQPHRSPDREGGRARPRAGPGRDRGGARGGRPARPTSRREQVAKRALGAPDALREAAREGGDGRARERRRGAAGRRERRGSEPSGAAAGSAHRGSGRRPERHGRPR